MSRCELRRALAGWRQKPKSELETRHVIQHFDPRAMQAGDGGNQAQPEPVARRVATVFEPIKAPEDMLVLVSGNSRPVIGDRDYRATVNGLAGDDDLSSGAAMLDGIVHEIG